MTTTQFIVSLTAWLSVGLVATQSGVVAEGTIAWYLLFGIPGTLYAMVLFGGAVFSALTLSILLLRRSQQ